MDSYYSVHFLRHSVAHSLIFYQWMCNGVPKKKYIMRHIEVSPRKKFTIDYIPINFETWIQQKWITFIDVPEHISIEGSCNSVCYISPSVSLVSARVSSLFIFGYELSQVWVPIFRSHGDVGDQDPLERRIRPTGGKYAQLTYNLFAWFHFITCFFYRICLRSKCPSVISMINK